MKETDVRRFITGIGILALALSGGCLDTHQGLKSRETEAKVAKPIKDEEIAFPKIWRRIGTGFKPKVALTGYLRIDRERKSLDEVEKTFWVFDKEFNKRGFYFETGLTFRKNKKGEYERVGIFDLDTCVAKILRLPGPVNYYAMNPPEGSSTPFFDELNPPKTPAPKKADGDGDSDEEE